MQHIFGTIVHIFSITVHIFGTMAHIFGTMPHIFGTIPHIFNIMPHIFGPIPDILGIMPHSVLTLGPCRPLSYGASFGMQTIPVYLATEPWRYEVYFCVRDPLYI